MTVATGSNSLPSRLSAVGKKAQTPLARAKRAKTLAYKRLARIDLQYNQQRSVALASIDKAEAELARLLESRSTR